MMLSDDARLTSVAYIGPNSIRCLGRLKLAEVAHVTCDSRHYFQGQKLKVNLQGVGHVVAASRTVC